MGNRNSGRYSNEKRRRINAAIAAQPSLFGDEPVLPYPELEPKAEAERQYIPGATIKERVKWIKSHTYTKPTVSLEEYSMLVLEWLRLNPDCYSVLDFYEDRNNAPFEYTLQEVMEYEPISILLEQRIGTACATGRIKGGLAKELMANRFGWVTQRAANKNETTLASEEEIKFEFGS